MANKAYKRFSNILKDSGTVVDDAYFRWMFDDKTAPGHKLLNWIGNNITSDNYLTLTEQREYNELLSSGQLLDDDSVSQAISFYEEKYPGLFDDFDEAGTIAEIKEIQSQLELLNKYSYDVDDNTDVAFHKEQCLIELKSAQKQCFEIVNCCQESRNELQYTMKQLQKLYENSKSDPIFISKSDIDLLIQKPESFRSFTKLYLENQFPKHENSLKDKTDLMMLYERLNQGYYSYICSEIESKSREYCLEQLPELLKRIKTIPNIGYEVKFITMSTENLHCEQVKFAEDIEAEIEKFVLCKLMKAQYDSNLCKFERRKISENKLIKLESILKEFISLYEMLGYILSIEGNYIKKLQTAFKDVIVTNKNYERAVKLRIFDISKLTKNNIDNQNSQICDWLMNLMHKYNLDFKLFENTSDIVSLFNKLQADKETEIFKFHDKINMFDTNNCDKILNDKNNLIYCNISKSPVSTNVYHYNIYRFKNILQKLELSILSGKNIYKQKKQAIESNKILEALHDLWINFLCKPDDVFTLINDIKIAINKNSRILSHSRI